MAGNDDSDSRSGCMVTLSLFINLMAAIVAVTQLSGFWRCTLAFLTFLIGGTIGGSIGRGIGEFVVKAATGRGNYVVIIFIAALIGTWLGSTYTDYFLGRLFFNIDFVRIMQK